MNQEQYNKAKDESYKIDLKDYAKLDKFARTSVLMDFCYFEFPKKLKQYQGAFAEILDGHNTIVTCHNKGFCVLFESGDIIFYPHPND